jgi:flagellar protein FlaG
MMQIQATGSPLNLPGTAPTPVQRPAVASNDGSLKKSTGPESNTSAPDKRADDKNSVQEATKRLQDFVSGVRGDIQFSVDSDSGKTVVKVVDSSTKEVIRQFPSEEAIDLAKALDRFQGLLVKQQA